jgi:iron complex outermembrane receptor protein
VVEQFRRAHRADHAGLHNGESLVQRPITLPWEKQSINLRLDMMNLGNSEYNEYEYISSGGYFAALAPNPSSPPNGYINAYPGAPRTIYGTISYQF